MYPLIACILYKMHAPLEHRRPDSGSAQLQVPWNPFRNSHCWTLKRASVNRSYVPKQAEGVHKGA